MLSCLVAVAILSPQQNGGPVPSTMYDAMRWRMIGPFRGGRTVGADGIADQPNTFFIGVNNGGVWKTTDAGRTWIPIFDDQPTGSIGNLAVAPSNPNVIYVGSGEGLQRPDLSTGDGMYKSTDGGKTWSHLGLTDAQQISAVVVDPKDENRVYVAALGHPYGPNEERGAYRTTDGGKTWQKVLYKDIDTGCTQVVVDPSKPNVVYADLWSARQGPWENGQWQGPGSGLYKSVDGGDNWRQLTNGLPSFEQGLGRIGMAVAPSDSKRLYAMVDASVDFGGVYRSDDSGATWRKVNNERRLWGRGSDFAEVKVDPLNPDRIYVANTSTYRSDDGGKTFTCIKGSPGGDDYHTIWINPKHPDHILLAADQGACISVNGGETWSSWYNQPTAQFYHVITDNAFPYNVYGGQQESGSAGVASRGPDGQITFREWHPVGADEYAYVAPDPLNARYIYGGKVTRYDKLTGDVQFVGPAWQGKYRALRTAPLLFSDVDPHMLLFATNVLWQTVDGGKNWEVISPDLSREKTDVPESIGVFRTPELSTMARRGVIYAVAPSHRDIETIWAGTDDGLVHLTQSGGKVWKDVTPPGLTAWSKVSQIDAGHFDKNTAYVAVNRFRLDDLRPHIYKTHDAGKTWTEIVNGLPNDPINTVREDSVKKGLLFCGSERAVYFSLDDGATWNPLRLNMPATSIRDLVVHQNDLVVGTHGRSFWVLDDMSPLRELPMAEEAHLFTPSPAYLVEWNANTDTPLPPEEPAGKNPPDGAILYYYLPQDATDAKLEILEEGGKLIRSYSSSDAPNPVPANELTVMEAWQRPPQILSAKSGSHRFIWDLRPTTPPTQRRGLPMTAIWNDTPVSPRPDFVKPGKYRVRLTVDGKTSEKTIDVRADPRIGS